MGDFIGHECGLALVRLRQPLSYYRDRYGDIAWGLRRLYLLMEKQHNRGQDGAGLAVVKLGLPPGQRFLAHTRSDRRNALERIFDTVTEDMVDIDQQTLLTIDGMEARSRFEYLGDVYLGHLRYGTHSGHGLDNCHPLVRMNNMASRTMAIAGNFNLTNAGDLFTQLVEYGLNPTGDSDTQVVLERIGYFLDREHEYLRAVMGPESFRRLEGRALATEVGRELDLVRVLRKASENWDGGYVFAGVLGNGDAFVCRDPAGIRPGFFHIDDEVVAVASERAALANVFNTEPVNIAAIKPGHMLVVKADGRIRHEAYTPPLEERQCTFERVYFSRGNDPDIYAERKALGQRLAPRVLDAIDHDVDHAVVGFIPNTAEIAYLGLVEEMDRRVRCRQAEMLAAGIAAGTATEDDVRALAQCHVRAEKVAHKDQRLRTFITHDRARRDLVAHIYDITRGVVAPEDTLIVLDDSIVRGTTLRDSIITILSRLNPTRIIVVSSAPPILYPDCYGIDMSQLGRFIGFEAAVALLRDRGELEVLDEVEAACRSQIDRPDHLLVNHVARIYERCTLEEIQDKVAELVRPTTLAWDGAVSVIYQRVEDLQASMPDHTGDWFFTGRYPTPGGYRVLNRSFLNWRARSDERAY